MMKTRDNLSVIVLMLLTFSSVWAQENKTKYSPENLKKNFENVHTINGKLFYEQRLFRNPFIGLYEINKVAGDTAPSYYVPLLQGMPVGAYRLGQEVTFKPLSGQERKEYIRSSRFPIQKHYKFDFWIQPYFAAIFGNFDRPVQSNTSVALQTQIILLPGLSFNTGIMFPIINQLDGRHKTIRPTATYLNQFYAAGNHYISATAGLFNNDQYGLNVQYRHADLRKPWSFGIEAGLTGYYYYPKGGIYIAKADQLLLLGDITYRLKGPDLSFKVSGGQFLWADKGARVEMIRQFTNVEIAFYATKTQNGSTLGFNFAIPIPPGKIAQGRNTRLRTTDEFRWEYSYTRGYRIGERYRLGYQLDQKLRQYQQDYFNNQLKQLYK
jgi:hypothetical protein